MSDVHVEPILAYRVWDVGMMGDKWSLCSTRDAHPWPRLRIVQALCYEPHQAPAEDCECRGSTMGCGFYALKKPDQQQLGRYTAFGEVWLWGKVIEHEDGYRAEYAYPAAIYSHTSNAKEIAELYGVPVKEPPYVPDRQTSQDNPGGANNPAGTVTANTTAWQNVAIAVRTVTPYTGGTGYCPRTGKSWDASSNQPCPYCPAPPAKPRARKGARLKWAKAFACAAMATLLWLVIMPPPVEGWGEWMTLAGASAYTIGFVRFVFSDD